MKSTHQNQNVFALLEKVADVYVDEQENTDKLGIAMHDLSISGLKKSPRQIRAEFAAYNTRSPVSLDTIESWLKITTLYEKGSTYLGPGEDVVEEEGFSKNLKTVLEEQKKLLEQPKAKSEQKARTSSILAAFQTSSPGRIAREAGHLKDKKAETKTDEKKHQKPSRLAVATATAINASAAVAPYVADKILGPTKGTKAYEETTAKKQVQAYLKKCTAAQKENEKVIAEYARRLNLKNVAPGVLVIARSRGGSSFTTQSRVTVSQELLENNPGFKAALDRGVALNNIDTLLYVKGQTNALKLVALDKQISANDSVKDAFVTMTGGLVSEAEYKKVQHLISSEDTRLKNTYVYVKSSARAEKIAQDRITSLTSESDYLLKNKHAGLLTRDLLIERLTALKDKMKTTGIATSTGAKNFATLIAELKHPKVEKKAEEQKKQVGPKFWDTFGTPKSQFYGRAAIVRNPSSEAKGTKKTVKINKK